MLLRLWLLLKKGGGLSVAGDVGVLVVAVVGLWVGWGLVVCFVCGRKRAVSGGALGKGFWRWRYLR